MRGLALDDLPVWCDELTGHHTQTAEALREDVRLDVAVVVLTRPNAAARGLDRLRHHVVDEPVLIVDAGFLKRVFVLSVWWVRMTVCG